jgi:hypothetical protein
MNADKRFEAFSQTNKAVVNVRALKLRLQDPRGQGLKSPADALSHEEGIVTAMFGALDGKTFQQLAEDQVGLFIQFLKKAFHVATMFKTQRGRFWT